MNYTVSLREQHKEDQASYLLTTNRRLSPHWWVQTLLALFLEAGYKLGKYSNLCSVESEVWPHPYMELLHPQAFLTYRCYSDGSNSPGKALSFQQGESVQGGIRHAPFF